jgi:excisionase family DNA binding protein
MKRPDGLPIYLTADEAADLLRTTRKAIYAMIERRQLPGVRKIGKRLLISASILLSWIEDQQVAPSLPEIQR